MGDHVDYNFRPGTLVLYVGTDQLPVEATPASKHPSWRTSGQVVETSVEGKVRVRWADGTLKDCEPMELFRVRKKNPPLIEI